MEQRQLGTRATFLLSVFSGVESQGESEDEREAMANQKKHTTSMVMRAYEIPRWNVESSKIRAVEDFATDVEFACLKAAIQ